VTSARIQAVSCAVCVTNKAERTVTDFLGFNGFPSAKKFVVPIMLSGSRGGAVVEALRYKQKGRGIDSRWCHWRFFIDIILPTAQ
jgi:hypothetical protein